MLSLQEIWKRIEAGFEMIHASVLLDDLRPGATDTEIQDAERLLEVTFPDEVKASYHLYNGSNGKLLIGDPDQHIYRLYSFVEMMSDWQGETDLQRQIDDQRAELKQQESEKIRLQRWEDWMDEEDREVRCDPDRSWDWYPGWIPLGRSDAGVLLCLDLNPGPGGQIGQIIKLDFDSGDSCAPVVASSWQALLFTFAQDLEAGEYCLRENNFGGFFLSCA